MRILYIDLNNSGISGDMFFASLLGLVSEPDNLINNLIEIKNYLPGVSKLNIDFKSIPRSGIQLNQLKLEIKESRDHRSPETLLKALESYLNDCVFSDSAKNYAFQVLNSLIRAEEEVHGKLAKDIHLHEFSSIDTLIDILGVTSALDKINGFNKNFKIYCSRLPLGGGKIKTAHGELAIPAPAP